jgi:hypothetical protein
MELVEAADRLDQVNASGYDDGHGGDADRPTEQSLDVRDGIAGALGTMERTTGRLEEGPAGVGELGAAPTTDEEFGTKLPLECQQ